MSEPSCAHLNIRYAPKSLENHSYSERWMCSDCDTEFLPKSRFEEAHAAGAAGMVGRCAKKVCEYCLRGSAPEQTGKAWIHRKVNGPYGVSDYTCEASVIRQLSPNPNYLAEIKAGMKEECADYLAQQCAYLKLPTDKPCEDCRACNLSDQIRALSPNHSDVAESALEILKQFSDITGHLAGCLNSGSHVTGNTSYDNQPHDCSAACIDFRALLKEGE